VSPPAEALESLLALDPDAVVAEQRGLWDRVTGAKGARIVLFGAGRLGHYTVGGLAKVGIRPLAIADNARHLWDTHVAGIPVLSPDVAAARYRDGAAFVITTYNTSQPRQQLAALGVTTVVPHAWLFAHHPDALLPHGCLEHPRAIFEQAAQVRLGFALMSGAESRAAFVAQLRWRLFLDFDRVVAPQTEEMRETEYFPRDLYRYSAEEVLVDCGAFDGDTVRRFLNMRGDAFRRVHACEPDPANRARLEQWSAGLPPATREKIRIEPVAVGAAKGKARFAATGTAGSGVDSAGTFEVDIATIDDLTAAAPPTLIKMDVEGAELDALDGARTSISAHAPVLAVCVYHTSDHLWRVPLRIASMSDRFTFHLRAHAEDCWDVTCYAIPTDRVLGSHPT
jgi:FkbM family methyltransferase